MREVLERANFELLVLVGDTYQIESIEFGNWFDAVRFFLPQTAVCELTTPYRSDSVALLNVWKQSLFTESIGKIAKDVKLS